MSREFMRAIFKGDEDKFNSLLEDIDIDEITESEKWNYLHRALISVTMAPPSHMIKKLIDLGVDVNHQDCYGNTPLHYAARIKDKEIIELILNAGAEIDHVNIDGITPLRHMLLSKPTDLPAVELLLARGANQYHSSTPEGCTVREYAAGISHGEDADLISVFDKYVH